VNASIIHDDHERQQLAEGLFVALSRPFMGIAQCRKVDGFSVVCLGIKTIDLSEMAFFTGSQ